MTEDVSYQIDDSIRTVFCEPLKTWFDDNKRSLPWRVPDRDPYAVWVSEIMLQQTRIDQMLPFYERFLARYPDLLSLAAAPVDDLLLVWEGLGYYSRCRNLHRSAVIIKDEHNGIFPTTASELQELPGVGRYTAAAIASSVFGEPTPAIDGNVKRVLSRVFSVTPSVDSGPGVRLLYELAERLIDEKRPGDFNESLMELGATICTPKSPDCPSCPLSPKCTSYHAGTQSIFPKRTPKKKAPHHTVAVAIVIKGNGEFYVQQRPETGLLAGLWEFPGGKKEGDETLEETCLRELNEETGLDAVIVERLETVQHAYSHLKVSITPFVCRLFATGESNDLLRNTRPCRWISFDEIDTLVFPRANRKILEQLEFFLRT